MDYRKAVVRCAAAISLGLTIHVGAACATPEIESLKNSKVDETLSDDQRPEAVPLPREDRTQDQIEDMRRQFRTLNPDIPDVTPKSSDQRRQALGVPVKIADPNAQAPYWSAGKLEFKKPDGKIYGCSGQFVGDKVILTAAHCVINPYTGAWNSSFVFYRASSDHNYAQKVGWRCISVYRPFFGPNRTDAYDYAFILTDVASTKPPLSMVEGTPASDAITAIGYPGKYERGKYLYKVDGKWIGAAGGIATMSHNPLEHGASGGAWFANFEEGGDEGKNQVVSINSHAGGGDAEENGPLFTGDTTSLRNYVSGGGCMN